MPTNNPYSYSSLVTDPAMFFGREAELSSLRTRLRNMQSTSIVSLRRMGKSSLLYQLVRTLPDTLGQIYVPIYVNPQDARCRTAADFVKSVVTDLNEKTGKIVAVDSVTDMRAFSHIVDGLSRSGIHLVLCLDEFEEFVQHSEEFSDNFFEALRALGAQAILAMVTTSQTTLDELRQAGRWTSPFFNIFSKIELGLLAPEAARELRCEPFQRQEIELSSDDEELICELGGRHPFFLQMACYHLYEALDQPQSSRVDIVRESFDRDAEPHFGYLWDHLSTDKQDALRAVIGQTVFTDETKRVLEQLERLGVVEKADGRWTPFSVAFTRYMEQIPDRIGAPKLEPVEHGTAVPKPAVAAIGFLVLLTLALLTIGALTNNVMIILLSAISGGVLLFLTFWYRRSDVDHQ